MKKIFSILLACVVSFSAFVGFTQPASAEGHAYLTLIEIQCPPQSASGFYRYALNWKSEDLIPSLPKVNKYRRFFPTKVGEGDCYANSPVLNINQKFQFPVDRNILVQPAVGDGATPLKPFVIPATQNIEGAETTITDAGGYKSTIKYKVTFE